MIGIFLKMEDVGATGYEQTVRGLENCTHNHNVASYSD